MDQTILKVAMAAFFHDIGKFADRGILGVNEQYFRGNADLYLPFRDGRHTHQHSLYTAAFIESLRNQLPVELNSPGWGGEESFINLAACHHKPETPMQWVIAVADRVSSGWDRDMFESPDAQDSAPQDYQKVRLVPIFEQITIKADSGFDSLDSFRYCYPLSAVSPEGIFPVLRKDAAETDAKGAKNAYRDLFDEFTAELVALRHRDLDVALWFEHFDSLMMTCTSSIPAARAGKVVPDVSLYDHSRITAALAAAIYGFHAQNGTVTTEAINGYADKKFLVINGDFRGIQKFLFGGFSNTAKYRSKILRGRSFSISLLTELAADMLCREIGLPFSSVILNAAGKFTILAPNTQGTKAAVQGVSRKINDWLIHSTLGEIIITFSSTEASCNDFVSGRFPKLWDEIVQSMVEKKFESLDLERHSGAISGYLDRFVNEPDHSPVCSICGKRASSREARNSGYVKNVRSICGLCRDHVFLGTSLVRENYLVVIPADIGTHTGKGELFEPIFGSYQVFFSRKGAADSVEELVRKHLVFKYWALNAGPHSLSKAGVTVKLISGYVPRYAPEDLNDPRVLSNTEEDEGQEIEAGLPKTLNHIACMALNIDGDGKACGVEALGILKADVDHLGVLMACGLKEDRFTISRLATFSRQLNNYFAFYLPHLLRSEERFHDVYTVFAGGDDLFLIGPWNRTVELAMKINETFNAYVCCNPEVHLSAGVSINKPHTPIDAMAEAAETALESSKNTGRNRLTLFGETAEWETVKRLASVRRSFEEWLDTGLVSRVFFHRLNEFIRMAALERQFVGRTEIQLSEMACTKWRSFLAYAVERNVGKGLKGDDRKKATATVLMELTAWLMEYEGKLKIPVWSIMYDRR